jgi:hypothetical protein
VRVDLIFTGELVHSRSLCSELAHHDGRSWLCEHGAYRPQQYAFLHLTWYGSNPVLPVMNLSHVITEFSFGPYFPDITQPLDYSFEVTHDRKCSIHSRVAFVESSKPSSHINTSFISYLRPISHLVPPLFTPTSTASRTICEHLDTVIQPRESTSNSTWTRLV